MYVFGFDIPILELLVVFCIVVVAYLVLLEVEFSQLRKISRKFQDEENYLAKEISMLRDEINKIIRK